MEGRAELHLVRSYLDGSRSLTNMVVTESDSSFFSDVMMTKIQLPGLENGRVVPMTRADSGSMKPLR